VFSIYWNILPRQMQNCWPPLGAAHAVLMAVVWHEDRYARKSHDLGGAKTFLANDDGDNKTILGFYSVRPASVEFSRTPEIVKCGLAWPGWPWIESCKVRVLAENSCSRRVDAA